jgi:hypothetical protein
LNTLLLLRTLKHSFLLNLNTKDDNQLKYVTKPLLTSA